jgi:1-acyl-sn-glycerol-3-phosphate acyltransferase
MSESSGAMLRRSIITIPGFVIGWALWLAAAPVWLPVAVLVDLFGNRRAVAVRTGFAVTVYLSCEVIGIVASGGLWLWKRIVPVDAERWTDLHFRLEAWWGTTLLRAAVRLFGLRLEVEGGAELGRGPYLLILRHASTVDTLLASALVSRAHGIRLRYVLKHELLWDPCLDIVGNRLPNVFVDRFSNESTEEISRLQALARDLGPRDGVLIYPEGTRFSETKRQRILERFNQKGDAKMLEYARSLEFVLPPRPGGTLGLLEAAPEADVVVCAHTGFEGAASLAEFWKGALVDQVIRVQFRRIPRDEIPAERDARIEWIRQEWERVGAWVESHRSTGRK